MNSTMEPEEWRRLVSALASIKRDAESHEDDTEVLKVFLPLVGQANALAPQTLIVRGGRGAGKTMLFKTIRALSQSGQSVGDVFPGWVEQTITWIEGFSEEGKSHPPVDILQGFADGISDDSDLRAFWLGHLVGQTVRRQNLFSETIADPYLGGTPQDLQNWVPRVKPNLPTLYQWLDKLDDYLDSRNMWLILTYDHLDRISPEQAVTRERFVRALVGLWLSLRSRFRRLRCKIFLREDLYTRSLVGTPDASKLENASIRLQWTTEQLFRLLLRHMSSDQGLLAWLQTGNSRIPFTSHPVLGPMPPVELPEEGLVSRRSLISRITQEIMGSGPKKGHTHRWIPNHLQDAHGVIAPRSILNLFGCAGDRAHRENKMPDGGRLFTHVQLNGALTDTSGRRVSELAEEHPVVDRMRSMRKREVPMTKASVLELLESATDTHDGYASNGPGAFDALKDLGVLSERRDGRVDVPDIYRYGFEIKRRGGVKAPR